MDTNLFRKVNEALSARYGFALLTIGVLAAVVLMQTLYIVNRGEIVIERPMFNSNAEMIYARNQATRSVSEVWAYNAVMLFGNVNKNNIVFLEATAHNFLGGDISARLKVAHRDLVRFMESTSTSIRFVPNEEIEYDEVTGIVTIKGIRYTESLMNKSKAPEKALYEYRVGVTLTEYSPWISFWEEGVIRENI